MTQVLNAGGRNIGPGQPVFFIAEMSANHNQKLERAIETLRAAKNAGADAVKIQTYTADTMTIASDQPYFRVGPGTIWEGETLHGLYQRAYTPWEWYPALQEAADNLHLVLFSTPFDSTAVTFLEQHRAPIYKIASFELTDLPLIRQVARTGKPIIMSTGMATSDEIREAVDTARAHGGGPIALLKCTSAYPAPPDSMHLRTIPALSREFDAVAGLSDHTLGIEVPIAAVALGACLVEKHFTLSRAEGGPDSSFSLEPQEFARMVAAVRNVERALGEIRFGPSVSERPSLIFRRSVFVVQPIKAGDAFTAENIRIIRPGHGLAPKHFDEVLGRSAQRDLKPGTPLRWDDVADG
jgi:N-acetylneuraminate synthase